MHAPVADHWRRVIAMAHEALGKLSDDYAAKQSILGAWRLVAFTRRSAMRHTEDVFGPDPQGLLCYTADGGLSVVLSAADRITRFADDGFLSGTMAEKAAAYESYCSYAGRYTIDGDTITHHLDLSLFPNWRGSIQPRRWRFEEDCLVLTSQPIVADGQSWVYEARWRRPS
jgi:hypothetical protein